MNAVARDEICGVKFANENSNILYVSTVDGTIVSYDLRDAKGVAQSFQCDSAHKKPFTCFDLNVNDTILCAGTEELSCEAHLLYFDVRKNVTLGAYTDSHKDDVTQVKFHPTKNNILASGSTDGLINVFNIVESSEDDAIEHCLNTESSVQTINWHPTQEHDVNRLSCITHTNDFQLYNVEESELIYQCTRDDITACIKRKSSSDCYLVNSHTTASGDLFLLAGSNFNNGECLRSLTFNQNTFDARTDFSNNVKQIVRCSLFDAKVDYLDALFPQIFYYQLLNFFFVPTQNDTLITAGEGGIITVWESKQSALNVSSGLKMDKKHNKHKDRKPY